MASRILQLKHSEDGRVQLQLYNRASPSDLAQLPVYQWYLMFNTYEARTDMTVNGLFILGSDLFSRYLTRI